MANGIPTIVPGAHLPAAAPAGSPSHGGQAAPKGEETSFSTVLRRTAQRLRPQAMEGEDPHGPQEPGSLAPDGVNGAMPGEGTWMMPWLAMGASVGSDAGNGDAADGSRVSAMGGSAGQESGELTAAGALLEEGEGSAPLGASAPSTPDAENGTERGAIGNGRFALGGSAGVPSAGTGAAASADGALSAMVQYGASSAKPDVAVAAGGEAPGQDGVRSGRAAGARGAGKIASLTEEVPRMMAVPPAFGTRTLQGKGRPSLAEMTPRERAYALRAQAVAETEPRADGTVRAGGLLFAAPEEMEGLIVQVDGEDMASHPGAAAEGEVAEPSLIPLSVLGGRSRSAFLGRAESDLSTRGQVFADLTTGAGHQASQANGTVAPSAKHAIARAAGRGSLPPTAAEALTEGGDADAALAATAKGNATAASPVATNMVRWAHPLESGVEVDATPRNMAPGSPSSAVAVSEQGLSSERTATAGPDGTEVAAPTTGTNGAAVTEGAPAFAGVSSPWMPQPAFSPLGQAPAAAGETAPTAHMLAEDIVRMSFSSANGETQEATLQLHPEHLGRLAVKVLVEEGRVHVHMVAEQEATSSLLKAQLSLLREALGEHGLRLEHAHVDTAPGDESAFSFFSSGAGRDGGWPAGRGFAGEALGRQSDGTGGSGAAGRSDGDVADDGHTPSRTAALDGHRLNVRV